MSPTKWVRGFFAVSTNHPWLKGIGFSVIAALIFAFILADRVPSGGIWPWLIATIMAIFAAIATFNLNYAWDHGRGAREKIRPVERFSAGVGYFFWTSGTVVGTIEGFDAGLRRAESPLAVLLAGFGVLLFLIGTLLGGMPSPRRGLSALLLTKRVANWQIALSVAILVPLVGRVARASDEAISECLDQFTSTQTAERETCVRTDFVENASDVIGYNQGSLLSIVAIWLVCSGIATILYEPLKYRLEEEEKASQEANDDD